MAVSIEVPSNGLGGSPETVTNRIQWICVVVRWSVAVWATASFLTTISVLHDRTGLVRAMRLAFDLAPRQLTDRGYAEISALVLGASAFNFVVVIAFWRLMGGYLKGDIFSGSAARRLMQLGLAGALSIIVEEAASLAGLGILGGGLSSSTVFDIVTNSANLLLMLFCIFLIALGTVLHAAAEMVTEFGEFV